jgi:HEAT repeat protein
LNENELKCLTEFLRYGEDDVRKSASLALAEKLISNPSLTEKHLEFFKTLLSDHSNDVRKSA